MVGRMDAEVQWVVSAPPRVPRCGHSSSSCSSAFSSPSSPSPPSPWPFSGTIYRLQINRALKPMNMWGHVTAILSVLSNSALKISVHFRTQSDDPVSCCGKPAKPTDEIAHLLISLFRSIGFPKQQTVSSEKRETWGFTFTQTIKSYQERGTWGVGNCFFVSNTYSLHCHHQNDSALKWAVVWAILMFY